MDDLVAWYGWSYCILSSLRMKRSTLRSNALDTTEFSHVGGFWCLCCMDFRRLSSSAALEIPTAREKLPWNPASKSPVLLLRKLD